MMLFWFSVIDRFTSCATTSATVTSAVWRAKCPSIWWSTSGTAAPNPTWATPTTIRERITRAPPPPTRVTPTDPALPTWSVTSIFILISFSFLILLWIKKKNCDFSIELCWVNPPLPPTSTNTHTEAVCAVLADQMVNVCVVVAWEIAGECCCVWSLGALFFLVVVVCPPSPHRRWWGSCDQKRLRAARGWDIHKPLDGGKKKDEECDDEGFDVLSVLVVGGSGQRRSGWGPFVVMDTIRSASSDAVGRANLSTTSDATDVRPIPRVKEKEKIFFFLLFLRIKPTVGRE